MKYFIVICLSISVVLICTFIKIRTNVPVTPNDSLVEVLNEKYKELDTLNKTIDSLQAIDKIRDTIIITERYEEAKDGVIFVTNDSLNKLIFFCTDHL